MKMWKGLFKKEWAILKWGLITLALLNVVVVLIGPLFINRIFDVPLDFFTDTLALVGIWVAFNILVSVGVLLTSLGHEMKRPDNWLHSPASMLQLVGAKAVFASAVTAFLLVLNGVLLVITFLSSNAVGTISVTDGVLSLISVLVSIFLNSIFIMAIGFFIWSIYQVIYSRIGSLSGFATTVLFFLGAATGVYLSDKLVIGRMIADIFDAINEFGPVKVTDATFYDEHTSYLFSGLVPGGVIVSIGLLLVGSLFTVLLFVAGSMLFEKKVRL